MAEFDEVIATPMYRKGLDGGGSDLFPGEPNGIYHTLRASGGSSSARPIFVEARSGEVWHLEARVLTPIECERLQGFPDNWTDGEKDSARFRMLGNAVAVPVVEWIAERLVEVDKGV